MSATTRGKAVPRQPASPEFSGVSCAICNSAASPRRVAGLGGNGAPQFYFVPLCVRCRELVRKKPKASRRGKKKDRRVSAPSTQGWIDALRRSWNISGDCFRCEISGHRLDLTDHHLPLSLTCDHDPPGSNNYLIVAWLINDMKNDHTHEEFRRNVQALAEIFANDHLKPSIADGHHEGFEKLANWRRK